MQKCRITVERWFSVIIPLCVTTDNTGWNLTVVLQPICFTDMCMTLRTNSFWYNSRNKPGLPRQLLRMVQNGRSPATWSIASVCIRIINPSRWMSGLHLQRNGGILTKVKKIYSSSGAGANSPPAVKVRDLCSNAWLTRWNSGTDSDSLDVRRQDGLSVA